MPINQEEMRRQFVREQKPPTIREHLQNTIDKSDRAKELMKMLDAHPEIEKFLEKVATL